MAKSDKTGKLPGGLTINEARAIGEKFGEPPTRRQVEQAEPEPQTCGQCQYWHRMATPKGHCRRYPPLVMLAPAGGVVHTHPETGEDHWCGEYSRKA